MSHRTSNVLRALVVGVTLIAGPALAYVSSSCPAPCSKPPKSALFMREASNLDQASSTAFLGGTLLRGSAHTVVRVDATYILLARGNITSVDVDATVNGLNEDVSFNSVMSACGGHPICSVTATFWFDVDALEAQHPGKFVGQPLDIQVSGGRLVGDSPGAPYTLKFAAEVVKKK